MGLRSFALYRDLGGVANLIDIAFSEEEGDIGAQARDEFRALRSVAPLVWFISLFSPRLRDSFTGYVWDESGRIVGNANVYRSQEDDSRWLIGNVSVLPEYRRKGIARKLTEASIAYARKRKGRLAYLDVRANNQAAIDLYMSLGFTQFDSITELVYKKSPALDTPRTDLFSAVDPYDWEKVYELAKVSTPQEVQMVIPVLQKDYRPHIWEMIEQTAMATMGQGIRSFAIENNDRFDAYINYDPFKVRPYHKVTLMVRPEAHGKYEDMLATKALSLARDYPRPRLLAELRATETAQIEAFQSHGFEPLRNLLRMGLKL